MKAVTKTLVLQSFISNGWACCTPGYCTSTSSDTLTGKMGKTVILAVFTCFSKKPTQFIGRQQFFSAPPLIRTADCPLFLHPWSQQRIAPLTPWQVTGSRAFSNSLERMDSGKTGDPAVWKQSLASRANLQLIQTKKVHFRKKCRVTLPVLYAKYHLGVILMGFMARPGGERVPCPTRGRQSL